MRELSTNPHGDHVFYEGSTVTQLLRDSFGGNSLTMGIFNVQYGDPIGSTLALRAMKRCQSIMNFPVINDNRTIGLLRKYRIELASNQAVSGGSATRVGGDYADGFNLKIAELEKKLIEENLERIKYTEEKQKLIARMQEMKGKFNDLVQSKADL